MGVGFYCDFEVPREAASVDGAGSFEISDGVGDVPGLANGVGFVLFVREGRLAMLEGFTYDEQWPESVSGIVLRYEPGPTRDLSKLDPGTADRTPQLLRSATSSEELAEGGEEDE